MELIKNNLDKVNWIALSSNYNAIDIIANNVTKIDWKMLGYNKNCLQLINMLFIEEPNIEIWEGLSQNKDAINLISKHIDLAHYKTICMNTNSDIVPLLKKRKHNICWSTLSKNEHAISMINEAHKNKDRLTLWEDVSTNKGAIDMLTKNVIMINWICILVNEEANDLIESNIDLVQEALIKYKIPSYVLRRFSSVDLNKCSFLKYIKNKKIYKYLSMNPTLFD